MEHLQGKDLTKAIVKGLWDLGELEKAVEHGKAYGLTETEIGEAIQEGGN